MRKMTRKSANSNLLKFWRWRIAHPILLLSCTLAVAAGAAGVIRGGYIGMGAAALESDFEGLLGNAGFAVRKITLSGQERTSADTAYSALVIAPGDPIFAVRPALARARLLMLPWVADAEVRRQFPQAIHSPRY